MSKESLINRKHIVLRMMILDGWKNILMMIR